MIALFRRVSFRDQHHAVFQLSPALHPSTHPSIRPEFRRWLAERQPQRRHRGAAATGAAAARARLQERNAWSPPSECGEEVVIALVPSHVAARRL
jgi:hypothetical protein